MSPRLTIVLPLKGRPLFTLRFLWHANAAALPYRIIVADGQVEPELARLLDRSRELFPALDVDYVRYPDDADFRLFQLKMADALGRVRTPFAMIADNDDFPGSAGIERSLDFLETHPDYVCCGGGIAGFSVHSRHKWSGGAVGVLNRLSFRYMPNDRSLDLASPTVTDRLIQGLRNSWSYYAVFRSPALLTVWREAAAMDLGDFQLLEKFCAMRTLTLGKARSEPDAIGYFRQYWTSLRLAFSKDWVHHLLRSRFSTDFTNIIERISATAAAADGIDKVRIAEALREQIEPWLRNFLKLNYGISAVVRGKIRQKVPALLLWLKNRRRLSVLFERRRMYVRLRKNGASQDYIRTLGSELDRIEDTISGAAFRDFITPHLSQISPEPGRSKRAGLTARWRWADPSQNV